MAWPARAFSSRAARDLCGDFSRLQGVKTTTTLVATFVTASALVFVQPVFAQKGGISAAEIAINDRESSMVPNFEEPWSDSSPSFTSPALAPAPGEPEYSEPESMFVPPPPVGLIEPGDHPAISPTSPTLIPPGTMDMPAGGFGGRLR